MRSRRRPLFEALEARDLMAAHSVPVAVTNGLKWLKANVSTVSIRTLASTDFQDGALSRTDMISIFRQVEAAGALTSAELTDLKAIVAHAAFFTHACYVEVLSEDIVLGNAANAHYQGATLGNLAVGSSAAKLEDLVDKWFLGSDLPVATSDWVDTNGQDITYTYSHVAGQLFVKQAGTANAVSYTDVQQGGIGDCYFLSSLAEIALKAPSAITSMFVVNGDGTYTVRFMEGHSAQYVTVNSQLPTDANGYLVFDGMDHLASNASNELWVALAEKAYVEINESGWIRSGMPGSGHNVYNAISGGCMFMALNQITGLSTVAETPMANAASSFNAFAAAFNAGKLVCLGSVLNPANGIIVGDHAYAVLSVNKQNDTVTVFNPWGLNNGHDSGVITLSWSQIVTCFYYYDRTA
jgi:hypothetical protein